MKYNFEVLSPTDFEELTRDLLQKHLGIYLESFKEGRDFGIDLRYCTNQNDTLIIQCKRHSHFKQLYHSLTKEKSKVDRLKPQRYIISTSVDLTVSNKEKIKRLFGEYVHSTADIYGRADLNNLISQHGDIERKYFKLWLSSTNVLNSILHSAVVNRSEFSEENVLRNIQLFVPNKSLDIAHSMLDELNYVILSGSPGVGKTTLGKLLAYELLHDGFTLVEVSGDITDAEQMFQRGRKQVFFYDDFLGSNFLNNGLNKNEDKRLLAFMERIRSSADKKLIMTTREYILNQAKLQYEQFQIQNVDVSKCIVDVKQYTKLARARIFYNHLFFSRTPYEYINALLENTAYKSIVDHKNYNPRVIEFMTYKLDTAAISPNKYVDRFIEYLNNPSAIWNHAFETQISRSSQYLLLALATGPNQMVYKDLQDAFVELVSHQSRLYNFGFSFSDFSRCLKELENTFIKISRSAYSADIYAEFQNPSIRDFLINYISNNQLLIEALLESFPFFEQYFAIFTLDKIRGKVFLSSLQANKLADSVMSNFDSLRRYSARWLSNVGRLRKLVKFFNFTDNKINDFVLNRIIEMTVSDVDYDERQGFFEILFGLDKVHKGRIDFQALTKALVEYPEGIWDIELLRELEVKYPQEYSTVIREFKVKDFIAKALGTEYDNLDRSDEDSLEYFLDQLKFYQDEYSVDLSTMVSDVIDTLEDVRRENTFRSNVHWVDSQETNSDQEEDSLIGNMFMSLLSR